VLRGGWLLLAQADGGEASGDPAASLAAARTLASRRSGEFACFPLPDDAPLPTGVPFEAALGEAPTPTPSRPPAPASVEDDAAVGRLRGFLAAEPTNPDLRLALADALRERGGAAVAVPVLLAGAVLDPEDHRFSDALATEMAAGPTPSPVRARTGLGGEIESWALRDLLRSVGTGAGGVVRLIAPQGLATIELAGGRVLAASASTTARLGGLLVSGRVLTREVLADHLLHQRGPKPPRLGTLLVDSGAIEVDVLEAVLAGRIRTAVSHACRWARAEFTFEPRDLGPEGDVFGGLPLDELLGSAS